MNGFVRRAPGAIQPHGTWSVYTAMWKPLGRVSLSSGDAGQGGRGGQDKQQHEQQTHDGAPLRRNPQRSAEAVKPERTRPLLLPYAPHEGDA